MGKLVEPWSYEERLFQSLKALVEAEIDGNSVLRIRALQAAVHMIHKVEEGE